MRRDKIVAEVLLILSVVHSAIAAPAVVQQEHLDAAGAASEKRHIPDGGGQPLSTPQSEPAESMPKTVSPTPLIISNPEDSDVESELDHEPLQLPQSRLKGSNPSTPGSSTSYPGEPPRLSYSNSEGWEPSSSESSASPGEPLHLPQSGTIKSDSDLTYSMSSTSSPGEPLHYPQSESESELEPELNRNPSAESPPKVVTWGSPVIHEYNTDGTPLEAPKAPEAPKGSEVDEAGKFMSEEMIQKVKDYAVLGTVAGVSTGLINGMQKEIMGTVSPGAYVSALFPPISCRHLTKSKILTYDLPQ